MPSDPRIIDHLRAIAEIAGIEASEPQLESVAPQLIMLISRFPAPTEHVDLAETEPAFGLRLARD